MNKANTYLIEQIKQRMEGSPADALSDILPLSKEAIYRRLRGEVLFTLDEAVTVARELNISLDSMNIKDINSCTFKVTMPPFDNDPTKAYIESINFVIDIFDENNKEGASFFQVRPSLPIYFICRYEHLYKFTHLRWLYLKRNLNPFVKKFGTTIVPKALIDLENQYSDRINSLHTTLLLSELVFEYQLKEILHFYDLGILDKKDILLIIGDLHQMINDLEHIIASGRKTNGSKLNIYLTNAIQETTFGFTEGTKKNIAFIKFIDLNQGITENKEMYNALRNAFYDMKGYAILISESGSAKRTAFFSKQRAIVDEFLSQYIDE